MNEIAHLFYRGGGLVLPAKTPYEREVLVECIEVTTKRHGNLRIEVDGRSWTIRLSNGARSVCDSCSQWPNDLSYPGGSSGGLSVVSSRAADCLDSACELAVA
jgi:hypothetical protein